MAKINVKRPCYKTQGNNPKSGIIGKAITADINVETNEAYLYADGAIAESDKSWKGCTLNLETSAISHENQADLLGHEVIKEEGKSRLKANANDVAPYTGFGFYATDKIDNVVTHRAIWLEKIMFAEPSDTNKTKGENVEFGTHNLEGKGMANDEGYWKDEIIVSDEKDAIAWLDEKIKIEVEGA